VRERVGEAPARRGGSCEERRLLGERGLLGKEALLVIREHAARSCASDRRVGDSVVDDWESDRAL